MRWPPVVSVAVLGGLAAFAAGCSSPSSSTSHEGLPTTTTSAVAACPSTSVSAALHFTQFGGSSSSLAGAVVFRNTGNTTCALRGVPRVQVISDGGQVIPTFEAPNFAVRLPTAVLTAGSPTAGGQAGSSITFSSWGCTMNSFSLTVRFAGWTGSVPAAAGSPSGSCSPSAEMDQTVYIGPVTAIRG
jgi:hypothetical protein